MRKNWVKKGIVISMIVLFIGAGVASASCKNQSVILNPLSLGKTWYVGGNGSGNFTKIQDAIDNASDGDTVKVYNGTYNETINITKAINLIGENKDSTIIDAKYQWNVISVIANGSIEIKNFTLRNSNIIYAGAGIALGFSASQQVTISNNIIKNNSHGIYCYGGNISNNYSLYSNDIENNTIGVGLNGIGQTNVQIKNNRIIRNGKGIEGSSVKMIITIEENNISYNTQGIYFDSVTYAFIDYNKIDNNHEAISFLTFTSTNQIWDNNITNNAVGIYLQDTSIGNEVKGNNFINNSQAAYFKNCFANKWKENYWDTWIGLKFPPESWIRNFPKLVLGHYSLFPWFNFDWSPAWLPYNITLPGWN
jgi:parallel beta-helix repeat protein